jgi:hypothetical protein
VGLLGSTTVTVGGVQQTFTADSDTQITVTSFKDTTPVGEQDLVIKTPGGDTAPFKVTAIRLLINEVDPTQDGTDMAEFVEIATGVPNVNLAGYSLVLWNGNGDVAYYAVNLNKAADANGLLLVGNPGMTPTPAITFPNNTLQNGQDAVALYQTLPTTFKTSSPASPVTTATNRLIDALVYDTGQADDDGLLDALIGPAGTTGRVQVDENANAPMMQGMDLVSMQRCTTNNRRNGTVFSLGVTETPGAVNSVPACP